MPEIFKTNVLNRFLSTNNLLNLCSSAVNSQSLLCSAKAGVKCSYLRFLVYKLHQKGTKNLTLKKVTEYDTYSFPLISKII